MADEPKKVKRPTEDKAGSKKGAYKQVNALEVRDDGDEPSALMTTSLKVMEWASKRQKQITFTLGAAAVVSAGYFGWWYYRSSRELAASDLVAKGVVAEFSPIKQGDEDANDQKRVQFYASEDEKQKAALAAYAEAKTKYGDTGPGVLARLGEAGVYLDRREWDQAITAYSDVRNHPLATADANVRMRCVEGLGYAKEGKGNVDDARKSFDELMNMETRGAKPLGLYHLARLDAGAGKKDEAVTKLKSARDAISQPGAPSARYLKDNIEKLLGRLDPSSVRKAPPSGGPNGMPGMPGMQGLPPGFDLEKLRAQMGGKGGLPPMPMPPMPAPQAPPAPPSPAPPPPGK